MGSAQDGDRATARLTLKPAPTSVGRAREFVREHLRLWECDDPEGIVALLTSEVVANAVIYAATPVALALRQRDDALRVEAEDGCPTLPEIRIPAWDDPRGRGLLLVEALARCWGAEPRGAGKVVWFEYGPC